MYNTNCKKETDINITIMTRDAKISTSGNYHSVING
jgi:hypothetical protein